MPSLLLAAAVALSVMGPARLAPVAVVAHSLSGRVADSTGAGLASARVVVEEANRITATDQAGKYLVTGLPAGTYRVSFALVGYAPIVRQIKIADADVILNVALKQSLIELPAIQVTASPMVSDPMSSPQPTSSLDGDNLRTAQAPSLGATIDQLPGVHNWSTGSGIGKPVIRGLGSNRVLVVADGQRTNTQAWGDEHSPNFSTAEADRIEVVRGPQSVLYGSDALGGVVNIIPRPLPDAIDRRGFVNGNATVSYATNNEQPSGTVSLEGASGGFGARASVSGITSSDLRTPGGPLFNSGFKSGGGTGAVGYRGGWGSIKGNVSYTKDEVQIHEDPAEDPTATPFQRLTDTRAGAALNLPLGPSRLEVTGGYEHNNRNEIEAAGDTAVASGLLQDSYNIAGRFHHAPLGPLQGILGVSGLFDYFTVSGEDQHLIPSNSSQNVGVYAFEQLAAGRWNFSFGLRYDYRQLTVSPSDPPPPVGTGTPAQTRNYGALTGNVGALFRVAEPLALVLNVGRGFRAPSAFELFSNGPHEGTVEFDVGNPALKDEFSLNTDLAVRLQSSRVAGELGVFVNYIENYIYFQPTGAIDPGTGFEIFDAIQGNSILKGFEASLQWHATPYLHLTGTADYTRGQNNSLDVPLAWVPPFRATYTARLEGHNKGWFQSPYFSIGGESNSEQTHVAPDDYAPPGYTLLMLGGGFSIPTGSGQLHLDLTLRNALNTQYTSFMSRFKTYAFAPGSNLIIQVGTEF